MDNEDRAANTAGRDSLLPGPSAMAAVAADPQIAGNSLDASSAYGLKPCARGMAPPASSHLQKSRPGLHLLPSSEGRFMDSWYVSLVPASVALAIIGYSFWVAYA